MTALLDRKKTYFVLWRPGLASPPKLIIGTFAAGPPPTLTGVKTLAMVRSPLSTANDLWEIAAANCGLVDGMVYNYWFQITNANVYSPMSGTLSCPDPAAYTVDWRITSPIPAGDTADAPLPTSIIRFSGGQLVPTDSNATPVTFAASPDVAMSTLPTNNQLVIYELPTAWTKTGDTVSATNVGVGTFQDVLALILQSKSSPSFSTVKALRAGYSYAEDLGFNALELLPPADTFADRSAWGYSTSNYLAPDFDLGRPVGQPTSTANSDFLNLVRGCHSIGIRFMYDSVMAFSANDPYRNINYLDFHVQWNANPIDPEQDGRDGFGGDLWKYAWLTNGFDPISGTMTQIYPTRQQMLTHMNWWMSYYHLDGYRLDSVTNVMSFDFLNQFRTAARALWNTRWTAEGNAAGGADARFLTVGESLPIEMSLLGVLDGLWNDTFRNRVRNAIIGRNGMGQPSFEWTVREMIDCRNLGFADGSQAVNYIGSHDIGNTDGDGTNNDRVYSFLLRFGISPADAPARIQLAFVCLLTAVGIPMIFAGDEFAAPMSVQPGAAGFDTLKQVDPVNYDLVDTDAWRKSIFNYVANLVKFRRSVPALSVNDTNFIQVDFNEGKRVMVWQRGAAGQDPVVVVANFSDWASPPGAQYVVPNWPATPPGRSWKEITQQVAVPSASIGQQPLNAWQAMVYTLA